MHLEDHAHDLAKELCNNHARFESFGWRDAPEDKHLWCIVYTHNRDSDALARSNARVIARTMKPFLGWHKDGDTAESEHHGHWACGWVDGFSIKVYTDDTRKTLTPAFLAYAELATSLDDYPVLDEEDYSREESEEADETWKNCYSDKQRLEYVREHRRDFEFQTFADMLGCVRGKYFAGIASELIG